MCIFGNVALNPIEIARGGGAGSNDEIGARVNAGNRKVRFNATPFVQQLGVYHLSHRNGDIVAAKVLQYVFGVFSLYQELAHRGEIVNADVFADAHMLTGRILEPVLSPPAVFIFRGDPPGSIPVRAFPAANNPKTGPFLLESIVKRRAQNVAG